MANLQSRLRTDVNVGLGTPFRIVCSKCGRKKQEKWFKKKSNICLKCWNKYYKKWLVDNKDEIWMRKHRIEIVMQELKEKEVVTYYPIKHKHILELSNKLSIPLVFLEDNKIRLNKKCPYRYAFKAYEEEEKT